MEGSKNLLLKENLAPIIVPVHNLGAGGNTPSFWLSPPQGLSWRHVMFNAYFLRDSYRASLIGDIVAWVDSGGFLFLNAPQRRLAGLHGKTSNKHEGTLRTWSEDLVLEVLRRQEKFGAYVAFTLDYPLPPESHQDPNCCPQTIAKRIRLTALGAALAYQLRTRKSMKLLVVLQYNNIKTLQRLLEILKQMLREYAGIGLEDVDGYAVGGLVPHSNKWWLLARRLQEARRLLGWGVWLHLLGVASPHNIALLYLAGADSMDSKTYIIAAAKRLYYQLPGRKPARIELKRNSLWGKPRDRCNCPICTTAESFKQLRDNSRLLTLHNLHVTLQAAQKAAQAYLENKLLGYTKQLAEDNPRLAKAIGEIVEPRPHIAKRD